MENRPWIQFHWKVSMLKLILIETFKVCSTMWVGCQSRRFNCLFWRETRQRILGQKNLAVSGSGKGTRTRVDDATQESSWWQESRERVGGWRPAEELVAGARERQLVAGEQSWWLDPKGSWWLDPREELRLETTEGSWDWTTERRTEKLAWKNGGAVNTRHRAERRGDKIGSSEEESQDVWFQ